ncbi:HAD family phosphatase [bacterium]|nr:HAD family phosphatase [bacterium]
MTIKALIFDCDGTLTDSMKAHFSAWYRALEMRGMSLQEEEFYRQSGTPSSRVIPSLARQAGVEISFEEALLDKERFFRDEIHRLKVCQPVWVVASMHLGKLPMAVASGGTRNLVHEQLTQVKMLDWFDTIVTCEDTERHKPDPDVFLEAADRLNIAPESCCVYEDGEPGIEAARRAGMRCVDVRPYRYVADVNAATEALLELQNAS